MSLKVTEIFHFKAAAPSRSLSPPFSPYPHAHMNEHESKQIISHVNMYISGKKISFTSSKIVQNLFKIFLPRFPQIILLPWNFQLFLSIVISTSMIPPKSNLLIILIVYNPFKPRLINIKNIYFTGFFLIFLWSFSFYFYNKWFNSVRNNDYIGSIIDMIL